MYAVTFVPWRDPYIRTSTHTLETKLAKCLVCCCKVQSVCLARRPIRKRESIFLVKIEKRNFALSISSLGLSWRWCDVDECWERMDVQRRKRIKQYTKNVFSRPTLSFIFSVCLLLYYFYSSEMKSTVDRIEWVRKRTRCLVASHVYCLHIDWAGWRCLQEIFWWGLFLKEAGGGTTPIHYAFSSMKICSFYSFGIRDMVYFFKWILWNECDRERRRIEIFGKTNECVGTSSVSRLDRQDFEANMVFKLQWYFFQDDDDV